MYNKMTVIGNLVGDPESRTANSGTSITSFRIASTYKYKDTEDVLFIDVTVFGKMGENVEKYLSKGSRALVEGRLTENKWEDSNGNQKSKMKIIANNVVFLSSKPRDEEPEQSSCTPSVDDPF